MTSSLNLHPAYRWLSRALAVFCAFVAIVITLMVFILAFASNLQVEILAKDGALEGFRTADQVNYPPEFDWGWLSLEHVEAEPRGPTPVPAGVDVTQVRLGEMGLVARVMFLLIFGGAFLPLIWGLWSIRGSFWQVAKGAVFTSRTIGGIRNLAFALVLMVFLPYVLTLFSPLLPGVDRLPPFTLSFEISSDGILFPLAAVIALLAELMRKAAKIAEENEQFI